MNTAVNAPTLADFVAWLNASQQQILDAMNASTGEVFGQLCDDFAAVSSAITVVRMFKQTAPTPDVDGDVVEPCAPPAPVAPLISTDIEIELFEVRNAIGLASFACEARRVLTAVDQVGEICPEVGAALSGWIANRCQWRELGDHTSAVLGDVRERLDTLLGDTP